MGKASRRPKRSGALGGTSRSQDDSSVSQAEVKAVNAAAGMPMQSPPSSNAASKPEVFVLMQTRIFQSVCDIQSQDDVSSVVGVYSSFRAAKVALRNKLAHFRFPRGDKQFYFGMWRGLQSEDHEGWPDLEEADEETVHHFMNDHAALLAGEPGAEDRFKLVGEFGSYTGYLLDSEGNAEGMLDMENGMHPFKWNESWGEGEYGEVSTYWEDNSFATEGMEAHTLQIEKAAVQA